MDSSRRASVPFAQDRPGCRTPTPRSTLGILAGLVAWLLSLLFLTTTVRGAASESVLENGQARLVFETAHGGLQSLEDKSVGHDHRDSQPAGALWTLLLGDGRTLDPAQAGVVSFPPMATAGQLEIRWTDFHESQAQDLTVTARITLDPAAPVSQWRIAVLGTGGLEVRSLHYPRLTGIARQDREVLAVPVWMGEQTRR